MSSLLFPTGHLSLQIHYISFPPTTYHLKSTRYHFPPYYLLFEIYYLLFPPIPYYFKFTAYFFPCTAYYFKISFFWEGGSPLIGSRSNWCQHLCKLLIATKLLTWSIWLIWGLVSLRIVHCSITMSILLSLVDMLIRCRVKILVGELS